MDIDYLKKVGLYILTVLLSLGAIFYFGYHIWHSVTKEVKTLPVSKFTAENTVDCDAYIFRDETPLTSAVSGKSAVSSVRVGEKVQVGCEVARVYSESSPKTAAQIADLEDRIKLLENCDNDGTVSLKDSTKIEDDIHTALSGIRDASANGDLNTARELRSVLMTLMSKRALLTGNSAVNYKSETEKLEKEKQELSNSLGTCLGSVTASVGGYYYPETDGYEKIFSASEIDKASYESLKSLLGSSPDADDNCAGKIVTNSFWYIVCPIEKKYLETFRLGGNYTVNFSGSVSVSMEVSKILSGSDGVIVVLKTNYIPEGFSFARMQKAQLVVSTSVGYKVPVSAVRMVNEKQGVYVLDGVTVKFRRIKTIYKNDAYYVVAEEPNGTESTDGEENEESPEMWLRFHDNLIIEGKGLYDGRIIG